jgi:hypothetical protein
MLRVLKPVLIMQLQRIAIFGVSENEGICSLRQTVQMHRGEAKVQAHHSLEVMVNLPESRFVIGGLIDARNFCSVENLLSAEVVRRPLELTDNMWALPDRIDVRS